MSEKTTSKKLKKPARVSKKPTARNTKKITPLRILRRLGSLIAYPFVKVYRVLRNNRRSSVHKTFQRSRRRDKRQQPKVEGLIAFSWSAWRALWADRWLYSRLFGVFLVLSSTVMIGMQIGNVTNFNALVDNVNEQTNSFIDPLMRGVATVGSAIIGTFNANLTDAQSMAIATMYLFVILVMIWLLRQRMAGQKVNVRDGLYSAGAPILALFILVGIGILQLVPFGLSLFVYSTANVLGLLTGGVESAMFGLALFLVAVLTLYFMMTTIFSLFIVTIPGTYPFRAYQTSRRIVAGQRMRLLIRVVWLAFTLLLLWFVVLVPFVIIINSISMQNSELIPIGVQVMTGVSLIYGTTYMYLLYRRMIDEPDKER